MAPGHDRRNHLTARQFVLAFGVISMLADMVYEGARSVSGPYLATFGASAMTVGLITGLGEAVALVFRLASGPLSDRTQRYWTLSIIGYAVTVIAVPFLAVASTLAQVGALIVGERFGKAVRTPARDTMLAAASHASFGRGLAFAVHEAMDQSGAFVGPLIVAGMIALSGYRAGFAVLAVPGVLTLAVLLWLRRRVPEPTTYDAAPTPVDQAGAEAAPVRALSATFWLYTAFTATAMLGFSTFAVLAYHDQVAGIIAPALIPVTYAVAMAAAALSALGSGWLYDRIGLRALFTALPLAAVVPILSFSDAVPLVWVGAAVWGAAMGIHESTLRAAVADMIPAARRGTAYGVFTAAYGLAWLGGSTVIGALYDASLVAVTVFVLVTQIVACGLLFVLLRRSPG
ncbi:MFS transporter [Salinisphaera hydrothermalis]|uniref:MFS transporter n=1 Tax=Salinisphaera hydrothermalis TaxID=563188 RepID=UPI00334018D8